MSFILYVLLVMAVETSIRTPDADHTYNTGAHVAASNA